jgi:hypothetical protein
VRSIGPHDEIERGWCAMLESNLDALIVFVQGSDRIAEDVVDCVLGGSIKNLSKTD